MEFGQVFLGNNQRTETALISQPSGRQAGYCIRIKVQDTIVVTAGRVSTTGGVLENHVGDLDQQCRASKALFVRSGTPFVIPLRRFFLMCL